MICIDGRGWYQELGKELQELKAGDVVNILVDVKHWHGAANDRWFSHLAVEVPGENNTNAMAKLWKNEDIRLGVLVKICKTLECKLDDIVDIF